MSSSFYSFIIENNIIESITANLLSFKTHELIDSFLENIILPFINRDADGDGEADINNIKNLNIKFFKIDLKLGNFILTLIKYFIIIYLVYLFQIVFKKEIKN